MRLLADLWQIFETEWTSRHLTDAWLLCNLLQHGGNDSHAAADSHNRAVYAQRCNVRSALVLPVFADEASRPVGVLEIARHEEQFDFAGMVHQLVEVMKVRLVPQQGIGELMTHSQR